MTTKPRKEDFRGAKIQKICIYVDNQSEILNGFTSVWILFGEER